MMDRDRLMKIVLACGKSEAWAYGFVLGVERGPNGFLGLSDVDAVLGEGKLPDILQGFKQGKTIT
jgi:hypothetical protein